MLDLSAEAVFTEIYRTNAWGGAESVSGPGSSLTRTEKLRPQLRDLIQDFGIRSLLDAGCGDFNWMRLMELPGVLYTGVDVVDALVRRNLDLYSSPQRSFLKIDLLLGPLPQADLILCRDCLVHFSFCDVRRAIGNMKKSGSTWLLATNFTGHERNEDIVTGQWRQLNLQRGPFLFPPPVRAVDDARPDGTYPDKTLALYRINDLE